jgi:hypothetical protein
MASERKFVLMRETGDGPIYYKLLAFGLFWECTSDVDAACKFSTRARASKLLVRSGKNRDGWRVVAIGV